MEKILKRLWDEEQFVEYGLLLVLVSLVAIGHMVTLAGPLPFDPLIQRTSR